MVLLLANIADAVMQRKSDHQIGQQHRETALKEISLCIVSHFAYLFLLYFHFRVQHFEKATHKHKVTHSERVAERERETLNAKFDEKKENLINCKNEQSELFN